MSRFMSVVAGLVTFAACCCVLAQNPNFPGYIGVYVVEGNGGMQITGFIPNTPAAAFAQTGEISRGETILRVGKYNTPTLRDLHYARNSIPLDSEAKMILRDTQGFRHYVWISRNEAAAAAAAPGAAPMAGAPDRFQPGARGEGNAGEDYRPRGGGNRNDGGDYRPR